MERTIGVAYMAATAYGLNSKPIGLGEPRNTAFVTCRCKLAMRIPPVPTSRLAYVDPNAESKQHSLENEDSQNLRPPYYVKRRPNYSAPARPMLRHPCASDANQSLKAVFPAKGSLWRRRRQTAVVHSLAHEENNKCEDYCAVNAANPVRPPPSIAIAGERG
jgi:hypothetical protein